MTFLIHSLFGYSEVEARKILYRDGYTEDQIEILQEVTTLQARPKGMIILLLNEAKIVTGVWKS